MTTPHETDVLQVPEQTVAVTASSRSERDAAATAASAGVDADILTTAGQRHINLIWERTQQIIALLVVLPTVLVASAVSVAAVFRSDSTSDERAIGFTAFTLLATLTGSVIGFYFGRTNHQRVGGVGKDEQTR